MSLPRSVDDSVALYKQNNRNVSRSEFVTKIGGDTLFTGNNLTKGGNFFIQSNLYENIQGVHSLLNLLNNYHHPYGIAIIKVNESFRLRLGYFKSKNAADSCFKWLQEKELEMFLLKNKRKESTTIDSTNIDQKNDPIDNYIDDSLVDLGFKGIEFYVQTGSFWKSSASRTVFRLLKKESPYRIKRIRKGKEFYIKSGYLTTKAEAEECKKFFRSRGVESVVKMKKK
jgi:hypothetical protein